jgi:hypothetical protein
MGTASNIIVSAPDSAWTILTALGTLGAVIVTLYISVWRGYLKRPKLALIFDGDPASSDIQILDTAAEWTDDGKSVVRLDPPQQAWVRLKVTSEKGRNAAEDTEVMIVGAREIGPRFPINDPNAVGLEIVHTQSPAVPIPIEGQLLIWWRALASSTSRSPPSEATTTACGLAATASRSGCGPRRS